MFLIHSQRWLKPAGSCQSALLGLERIVNSHDVSHCAPWNFSPHHCVGFLLLGLLPPTDRRPTTDDRPTDRPTDLLLAPPLSFFYTHTRHTHVDSLTHTRQTHTRSLTVFYTHTRHTHVDSLTHTRQTHTDRPTSSSLLLSPSSTHTLDTPTLTH